MGTKKDLMRDISNSKKIVKEKINEKEDTGAEAPSTILPYKVSKIMAFPSRKIGLPNYSSVDLSAGMEIVFDKPQAINSEMVQDAYKMIREAIQKEFRSQFNAFGEKKKEEKTK